jgi:conjugal transfer pilus assembly protein TraK
MIFRYSFLLAVLALPMSAFADLVKPESTANVELSSRDTNRIVCSSGVINDVFYSQEKGIRVQIDGNSAYVKFLVRDNGLSHEYVTSESEFFVVCGGETYTLIANPSPTASARTIRLGNSYRERVEHMRDVFGPMTIEERAVEATKIVYQGNQDLLRQIRTKDDLRFWREDIVPGAVVSNHADYSVDGFGLTVREFRVEAMHDIEYLQEIQFMTPLLSDRILAITVMPHHLAKGEVARVFIVEKEGTR